MTPLLFVKFGIEVLVFFVSFAGILQDDSQRIRRGAIVLLLGDLIAAVATYFSVYEDYPWTKEIYWFAPVEYSASGYNEGKYYGGWKEEYPQGYGRMTYKHFVDEQFYSIEDSDGKHRAEYYEGEFDHGWRVGQGTVVYDGGYRDEGEFFGKWEAGKTVFIGKRWYGDDKFANLEIVAIDGISAEDRYETDYWIEVDGE